MNERVRLLEDPAYQHLARYMDTLEKLVGDLGLQYAAACAVGVFPEATGEETSWYSRGQLDLFEIGTRRST